jgi:copper oxidase (laccase) domain-containing protein
LELDCGSFLKKISEGKYILDMKEANKQILLRAGVRETNIAVSDICTNCGRDLFFSQRSMGNSRGTLAAFFCLKK